MTGKLTVALPSAPGEHYSLKFRESDGREVQLVDASLEVVDHDPNRQAVAGSGFVVTGVAGPTPRLTDQQGGLVALDRGAHEARPGEAIYVELGDSRENAALVVESRAPYRGVTSDSSGIRVDRQANDGSWVTAALFQPRRQYDALAVETLGSTSLRIVPLGRYPIRAVRLLHDVHRVAAASLPFVEGTHSRLGALESRAQGEGLGTTDLIPGDSLSLRYAASAIPQDKARTLFMRARGTVSRQVAKADEQMARGASTAAAEAAVFFLGAAYPNPSDGAVSIAYGLPSASKAVLRIYNVAGREVRTLVNGDQRAGRHLIKWDGRDNAGRRMPSGVYFYRLQAGPRSSERKLIILDN